MLCLGSLRVIRQNNVQPRAHISDLLPGFFPLTSSGDWYIEYLTYCFWGLEDRPSS